LPTTGLRRPPSGLAWEGGRVSDRLAGRACYGANHGDGRQIIFTKLAALAIALATVWWWRSEGFGWPATIAAGIGGYLFWKIAISIAIGRYQGVLLRAHVMPAANEKKGRRSRPENAGRRTERPPNCLDIIALF
jgi:hypothetical protein